MSDLPIDPPKPEKPRRDHKMGTGEGEYAPHPDRPNVPEGAPKPGEPRPDNTLPEPERPEPKH